MHEELTSCTQGTLRDGEHQKLEMASSEYLRQYRTHDSGGVSGPRKASDQRKGMPEQKKFGKFEKFQSNPEM